jgi:hypothetical protein
VGRPLRHLRHAPTAANAHMPRERTPDARSETWTPVLTEACATVALGGVTLLKKSPIDLVNPYWLLTKVKCGAKYPRTITTSRTTIHLCRIAPMTARPANWITTT